MSKHNRGRTFFDANVVFITYFHFGYASSSILLSELEIGVRSPTTTFRLSQWIECALNL